MTMMIDLGTLGGDGSSASGINTEGFIVGRSQTANGIWHAFLWMPESGMMRLDVPEARSSLARAINDNDQVLGEFTDEDGNERTFIWTATNEAQIIPTPYSLCEAVDINATGQALITAYDNTEDEALHVMLWSPEDGLRDLGSPYPKTYVSV